MEKSEPSQKTKIELGEPNYLNKNCLLANSLGHSPYKRCQYCESNFSNCIFLQYQIISLGLIVFSFVLSFIMEGRISETIIFSVFALVIVYGYFFSKSTDKIIETNFKRKKAEELALREKISKEEAEKLAVQERALRKRTEKLVNEYKNLDEAKTMFLNIASHQLRTPLSAMKGYLSMILDGNYPREKEKEFIKTIYRSNEREIELVNDLLDLNKLQTGKLQFNFRDDVQLEDIIEEIINEFQAEAQHKGLYLVFNKPKQPLPKITADPQKLRQVILNLIDNALKYTSKGGVTVNLKPCPSSIQISVQDTGMGMMSQEKEKLFQLFSRSEEATSVYPSGIGIGLYLSSEIVKVHKGKIWAESPGKGKGSTFYVELPVKK